MARHYNYQYVKCDKCSHFFEVDMIQLSKSNSAICPQCYNLMTEETIDEYLWECRSDYADMASHGIF